LDELFSILEGVISIEGEKMVIFSQWERMTRLIALELNNRGIKFESLHGGVPSKDRETLFTNFNTDPDCRIFLSTDAGGVGLNLQSAAYMVNMDIPWNPAVLEQRIARIYRMGQKKNVSIINLVAQGTIEERMLEVLKFKKSIATGIFDNGEDSIFMGESKFNKLMESVEAIATQPANSVPVSVDKEEKEEIAAPPADKEKATQLPFDFSDVPEDKEMEETSLKEMPQQAAASASNNQAADDLIQQGMKFFSNFMATLQNPEAVEKLSKSITEKDEKTGKTYLKLPVENEQMVGNALGLLAGLLKGLGK
jgi:superfamily II DNA/RNA helicase